MRRALFAKSTLDLAVFLSVILCASSSMAQETETPLELPPALDASSLDGVDTADATLADGEKEDEVAPDDLPPDDLLEVELPLRDPASLETKVPPTHRPNQDKQAPSSRYGDNEVHSDDDSDEVTPEPSKSAPAYFVIRATVVPGLIGLAVGAALPVTLIGAGLLGFAAASANNNTDVCAAGFASLLCAGVGVVGAGSAGTVGVLSGTMVGALSSGRNVVPALAGAGAGALMMGAAALVAASASFYMSAVEPNDGLEWAATVVPAVIFVLAGPVALSVSTLVDFSFFNELDAPRTVVENGLRDVVTNETSVAMPFRY